MDNRKRNIVFDIAKGLGILFVVWGHSNMIATKFFSLFHMALFFIISGIFIKDRYFENFKEIINFTKKRIFLLGGIFIACNGIFLILHNFFIDINIYSNNPLFLETAEGQQWGGAVLYSTKELILKFFGMLFLARAEQLGGATWFLRSLLCASVSFVLLKYIQRYIQKYIKVSNLVYCSCIIIISFLLSYVFEQLGIRVYSIGSTCSALAFLFIGHLFKEHDLIKGNIYTLIVSFIIILTFACSNFKMNFSANVHDNMFIFVILGILGFYFVYSLSKIIELNKILSNIFSYLGQHTLSILCLHLLAYKLVNFVEIFIYKYPMYMGAAFPTIWENQNLWCPLYILCGLLLPCLYSECYFKIKNKLKYNFESKNKAVE